MADRVSILIPCYNAERWIAQAIESALGQTWHDKEVVVVDDGSTDRSLEIIQRYDDRLRWETGPNRGGNQARNRLLELATGDWVQYLDADDYLLADKIERQLAKCMESSAPDVVYGPWILEYWSEKESRRVFLDAAEPRDPWILLVRWLLPQTGAPLFRREALVQVGGWNPDQPVCQEYELYLRLLMKRRQFFYCGEGGAVYRQWGLDTVCNRDMPSTFRRRLEITDRAETFLMENGELSPERVRAISQGRFEAARQVWLTAPDRASRIMARIRETDPDYSPVGWAAPRTYQVAFNLFGFEVAERLAGLKRGAQRFLPRRPSG